MEDGIVRSQEGLPFKAQVSSRGKLSVFLSISGWSRSGRNMSLFNL